MEINLKYLKDRYSSITKNVLNEATKDLPIQMKEAIKCIHKYGKTDYKRGMRYTKQWILECILLSIKSRKAYIHIRKHNILPLPTLTTLRTYLKNMKPRYGFDLQVFSMLKRRKTR